MSDRSRPEGNSIRGIDNCVLMSSRDIRTMWRAEPSAVAGTRETSEGRGYKENMVQEIKKTPTPEINNQHQRQPRDFLCPPSERPPSRRFPSGWDILQPLANVNQRYKNANLLCFNSSAPHSCEDDTRRNPVARSDANCGLFRANERCWITPRPLSLTGTKLPAGPRTDSFDSWPESWRISDAPIESKIPIYSKSKSNLGVKPRGIFRFSCTRTP